MNQISNHQWKKFLLPLLILTLTAVGCSSAQSESVPAQETATEFILETEFTAAASVQTEITDILSESVIESESVPLIVTETTSPESFPVTSESLSASTVETIVETTAFPSETLPTVESSTETESTASSSSESTFTETSTEMLTETSVESAALKLTYHDILTSILQDQCFQEDVFAISDKDSIKENQFAIYDVDSDGMDELIIRWAGTDISSLAGIIYGYDSEDNICCELRTSPYLRFYSNGIIEADAPSYSSGELWPYTLYKYDAVSNCYQETAFVKAASISDTSESADVEPQSSDFYYSVYFFDSDSTELKNESQYADWRTHADSPLIIPFQQFNEENIHKIP